MASYNKLVEISTYTIDKKLIESIEDYLYNGILEILNLNNQDRELLDIKTKILLHDSKGEEKYKTIKDYKFSMFRNDIEEISIDYKLKSADKQLKVNVRFGKQEEDSDMAINLTSESAIEKVSAIEHGINAILNQNKNLNRYFYPPSLIGVVYFIGSFFCGIFALQDDRSNKERFTYGLFFLLAALIVSARVYFKGYCSFDSNKQRQLDKWFTWLITGLAGFLLFSTLLTSVRKGLFGF